jgi:hypothetical protein
MLTTQSYWRVNPKNLKKLNSAKKSREALIETARTRKQKMTIKVYKKNVFGFLELNSVFAHLLY